MCVCVAFHKFPDFFVQAFKIVVDSWKFSILLLYILWFQVQMNSYKSNVANNLMSSMYIRWLTFSCDLLSLYPAAHFLSMWFSGIMAIMNSKGDSASPRKMPLWIFVSAKLLPPAVSSTLQVCMVFSMKFMTSCDSLYIFDSVLSSLPLARFSHQCQLSLVFDLQQVSSSLQNPTQYS